MRQTLFWFRFVVFIHVFSIFSVQAENMDALIEKREANIWLRKIQMAAQKLNYSGTFVYQQASQMRTSRITHVMEGKNEIEKLEILDGKPREYIRNNEEIVCYIPEAKTLLIEKRITQDAFPAILATNPSELTNYYSIKKGEAGRIAGFDCQSLVLEPKDSLRYGYKLWAEKETGLLLRAQTFNEKNESVEQIAFTQIEIGNIDHGRVKSSFSNTKGWYIENSIMSQVNLSNWIVKLIPPGFKKLHEMKRLVSDSSAAINSDGERKHASQREVSQIVFSDGLAAISVFIEPFTQNRTEGSMQQGAMNIVGKHQGDFWLTIVGEVPTTTIRQVANSIEFKTK
jgi:sigma-E factor negative regulatory protein RseB